MLAFLNSSAELALELVEKKGTFLPFCRAKKRSGETVVITPDAGGSASVEAGLASVQAELRRGLVDISEFAVCSDVHVKFAHLPDEQRVLKIEFQDGSEESAVYYFPLSVAEGRATVGRYLQADLPERLL
jgi:hypothetical protein